MKNKKGFTLIELLAVITIMGILMMVAIPAVSRTIENSRRDTFADVVQNYINTVRNSVLADEIKCATATDNTGNTTVSATPNGNYYFAIGTETFSDNTKQYITTQTNDMMESGGKSSWGNSDMIGYVIWVKEDGTTVDGAKTTKTTYYAYFSDKAKHGMTSLGTDQHITRSSIATSGSIDWIGDSDKAKVAPGLLLAKLSNPDATTAASINECKLK